MAKRYITTELFDDSWFMDLPSKYKLFWVYLLTKCNYSGIWQVNWKLAQFYTGDNLEPTEVQRILRERYFVIEDGKYWFIPKFIEFQYGDNLNPLNSVHKGIIETLKKYDLLKYLSKTNIIEGANKGLHRPYEGGKDKDMDKVKVKDKSKDKDEWFTDLFREIISPTDIHSGILLYSVWCDWVHYRKEIKKILVYSAAKKQLQFLSKQPDANKCIEQSIQNQWQGLFEEKNNNGTGKSGQRRKDFVSTDEVKSELKNLYEGRT